MVGLYCLHLELTSVCNKKCFMCGRRKIEKDHPELAHWGHMDFTLVSKIARQLPKGLVVQFHNNGEPLMYPKLGQALKLFNNQIRCFNTNGKLLLDKFDEIVDNVDVVTVSVIEDDPEAESQYDTVNWFIQKKGTKKPRMVYRILGKVKNVARWEALPGTIVKRILHDPMGSFKYTKETVKPEIGICLDALTHMAISKDGDVSLCVRFDPLKEGVIGNAKTNSLSDIWNGRKRQAWIQKHVDGKRQDVPLCSKCQFWGVPRG